MSIKLNYKKIFLHSIVFLLIAFPLFSFAQNISGFNTSPPGQPKTFKAFVCILVFIALDFVPYLFVIAIGAFLMGLIKYVGHGDNEEKRMEGSKMMIYGTLGLFFMISVWGILQIFTNSFNLPLGVPQFKETNVSGKGCNGDTFKFDGLTTPTTSSFPNSNQSPSQGFQFTSGNNEGFNFSSGNNSLLTPGI